MDFLTRLDADFRRLASVCAGQADAKVPTCPEWTIDDLVRHVAMVYLHKAECMRLNAFPKPWPPDHSAEPALPLLERAYADLTAEFAARAPSSPAATWFDPDQTVGFWIRRMAQETVIHRIDAELAAGADSLPIPDDLALDGVDELLKIFLAWPSRKWPDEFAEPLAAGPGAVGVTAGLTRWLVKWNPSGVDAEISDEPSAAAVSGSPEAVLRWLWRRADGGVRIDGDQAQVEQMRQLLRAATQ